jgi:hypothetical protein
MHVAFFSPLIGVGNVWKHSLERPDWSIIWQPPQNCLIVIRCLECLRTFAWRGRLKHHMMTLAKFAIIVVSCLLYYISLLIWIDWYQLLLVLPHRSVCRSRTIMWYFRLPRVRRQGPSVCEHLLRPTNRINRRAVFVLCSFWSQEVVSLTNAIVFYFVSEIYECCFINA